MNQSHSIAKNFIYQTLTKIFQFVVPIITIPYISRVLGSEGIGAYSFTNSVIQYFLLIGALGVSLHGSIAIAKVRDDINERSRVFWEIFSFKLCTSLIALCLYLIFLFTVDTQYKTLYLVQAIFLLSTMLDISWFFVAIEDFKKIFIRDLLLKILIVILIFAVIRGKNDLNLYALILSFSAVLTQFIMWYNLKSNVVFKKPDIKKIAVHFVPALILFIPLISGNINATFDRIMLGIFSNVSEVGYYDMAQKIITLSFTAITSLSIVIMPRMSNLIAKKDYDCLENLTVKSFRFISFLAVPMSLGLITISANFVPWFFGKEFLKTSTIIIISAPFILFYSWGIFLTNQIMLPMNMGNKVTLFTFLGALLNIIFNLLLIPEYNSYGAAFAWLMAKIIIVASLFYYLKNLLPLKNMFKEFWKYCISGLIMFVSLSGLGMVLPANIITTFIQIFTGIIIYITSAFILKTEINTMVIKKTLQLSSLQEKLKLDMN